MSEIQIGNIALVSITVQWPITHLELLSKTGALLLLSGQLALKVVDALLLLLMLLKWRLGNFFNNIGEPTLGQHSITMVQLSYEASLG